MRCAKASHVAREEVAGLPRGARRVPASLVIGSFGAANGAPPHRGLLFAVSEYTWYCALDAILLARRLEHILGNTTLSTARRMVHALNCVRMLLEPPSFLWREGVLLPAAYYLLHASISLTAYC